MFKRLLLMAACFSVVAFPASALAAGAGNPECPSGSTLLSKYSQNGGSYTAESGGSVVTITNGTASGGDFTVNGSTKVTYVIVKGGTDTKTDSYNPGVSSGSFNNSGLTNGGGQTPAISGVTFCGGNNTTTTTSGGRGGGQVAQASGGSSTTAATQATVPAGSVEAGIGDARSLSPVAAAGLLASIGLIGYGARRLSKLSQ